MKYIDAERLIANIDRISPLSKSGVEGVLNLVYGIIASLQQEQQMPDSTQLIAEWEKEKAVLEQKDFRGDAERMAYNAFLDGFVKGLGYEGTK